MQRKQASAAINLPLWCESLQTPKVKVLLPLQAQPAAVSSRKDEQDDGKQAKPEQAKQRQRRLFLQATSEGESEPADRVPVTAKHVPAEKPAKQQQAVVPKQQQTPAKDQGQARRARPVSAHEDKAQEVEDDGVPATYNNMPLNHKQSSQQVSDDDDASDEDAQEVRQAAGQQKKKRGHQKQQPAQVVGKDLDFAASDAESDEYEPTQAKAAAKAAAKKAADKAAQPKAAKGKPRQPKQEKQQGNSKQPHNAAKATALEGPAKSPRGRPRKAPQEQQPRQASKRKAAEVTYEEEEEYDEEVLPMKAAAKPRAKQGGRLKRAPLMSEANEDGPFHVKILYSCSFISSSYHVHSSIISCLFTSVT